MKVVYRLTAAQTEQLHALYQQEWWTKSRTLDETRRVVAGSQICIGLVDEHDKLVGFARVLTDYTIKALIFDVVVRGDHRNSGLGGKLLSLIKTHERLQRVKHFELYCLPEMFDYYAKHGFSTEVGDVHLMRMINRAHTS